MAGFFKKLAGVFVVDERSDAAETPQGEASAAAESLLASLEGAAPTGEPSDAASGGSTALPAETSAVLQMKPDEIYAGAGLTDGPNSALRVMKMLVGLAQFPQPQQLAMMRALDAADESWTEALVIEDARARQGALREHLQTIERARVTRLGALEQDTRDAQGRRTQSLAEIDAQVAELTRLREQAVADAAAQLADLDRQKQETELAADRSREALTTVVNQLGALVGFFASGGPPPKG